MLPVARDAPPGRAAVPARAAVLVLALVLALVSAPAIVVAQPSPPVGRAAVTTQVPGDAQVAEVTLTRLQPSVASSDDVLRLTGVLSNTADFDLVDPLPALRWSSDPLQTVDDVDLVAANPLFRYGRIDYRFADPLDILPAGEQVAFSIDVPLASLQISGGVFVIGVDVLATLPDGLRVFVADDRTTVPVDVDPDDPLPVAVLWPLASAPTLLPDGRLVDDRVIQEVSAGGRLSRLLDAAEQSPVTWVLDPDLVTTLAAMADGYRTLEGDSPESGEQARSYLASLVEVLGAADDVRQLPAADPDVGGALAAGVDSPVLREAVADGVAGPAVSALLGRLLPPLALLVDRQVTSQMLGVYLRGDVSTTVLNAASVAAPRPDGPVTVSRNGRDVSALVARVPPTGGENQDAAGPAARVLAARQWMVSTTAVHAALGSPSSTMVVSPPPRWNPSRAEADVLLDAWASTDWIEPTTLDALPGTTDSDDGDEPPVRLASGQSPTPLPSEISEGLRSVMTDSDRLAPLFPEPLLDGAEKSRVVARAVSAAWEDDPAAGIRYMSSLTSQVVDAESQIGLVVSPSITLASRSGRFPITLVNDAAVDVVVGVDFVSQNSSRLRVDDIEPVVLTAGEKRTFTPTALATANGRLQVTANLVTTEGSRVGRPATTIVDVTNVGALGWTVIGLGGALLVAALLRSRLRARRAAP